MTNQRINDVDTITTFSGTDRLLVNTDVSNNVLEQIEKDDFVADIISTDANNSIEVGTDNKLKTSSAVTIQGNTFNGNSQLIQTTSNGKYPALDGSLITGVSATIDKNITQIGTCSTASATAEKTVTLSGFDIQSGVSGQTIQVAFTNANTAATPTLNVNSTGAKAIYNEAGTAVSATNPAYFPAGSTVDFTYNGTNWVFKKRVIENYLNGTTWYRVYSDGWKEQGGVYTHTASGEVTITYSLAFKDTNYTVLFQNYGTNNSWTSTGSVALGHVLSSTNISAYTVNGFTTGSYSYTEYNLKKWWRAEGY